MNVISVDFNQNWNASTSFTSKRSYQILLKSVKQVERRRENNGKIIFERFLCERARKKYARL